MTRRLVVALAVVLGLLWGLAPEGACAPEPEEASEAGAVAWMHDVEAAFKRAAAQRKLVMICINAKHAIGEPEEPAAKGLREVVYKDPKVVAKSRAFVCVFLTRGGSSADFGELRARFGIDGTIVSPQHIFAMPNHADGDEALVREEYWRYGQEQAAATALVALMDRALEARRVRAGVPEAPPGPTGTERDALHRSAWIEQLIEIVRGTDEGMRRKALSALVTHDKQGDCTKPLLPLLQEFAGGRDPGVTIDIVRALGVPGLLHAAPALHELLAHKDADVRGNTAVTLEYIGCPTSVKPLLARLKREKDAHIANHLCRAIGRCGVEDAGAKKKLLRGTAPGDGSDFASYGSVIGLAYRKGDAKLARALEKRLMKLGSPFQVGSKANTFLRALMVWCLAEIGDAKSAKFLRRNFIKAYEDEKSPWRGAVFSFYEAAARVCEGDAEAVKGVDGGIHYYIPWAEDARELVDDYRRGRDMSRFVPKGEWNNTPKDE